LATIPGSPARQPQCHQPAAPRACDSPRAIHQTCRWRGTRRGTQHGSADERGGDMTGIMPASAAAGHPGGLPRAPGPNAQPGPPPAVHPPYGSLAMSLGPALRSRIEQLLTTSRVVLFMKGEPAAPQCGFSAKAVGLLGSTGVPYQHVDVLSDPDIREGIKVYGEWPTIPQLYIDGELIGGSDIIEQIAGSGELYTALG